MEPVTHLMTGAVLARAGFNRKTAYATLAMTLAAEAPDLDVLWRIRGPIAAFEHHRGWTHTFLGLPIEAAVVVGAVWLWHRGRGAREFSPRRKEDGPPARWGILYLFAIVALLSHLLLDWTNNYGLRPFFPFNPRWYAGSFVFIFEPLMFLLLLTALVAPSLFGLIGGEIGVHRERFRGRGWAIFALAGTLVLWGFRYFEKGEAEQVARGADYDGAEVLRVSVSPYPLSPFKWHAVVETPGFFQMSTVDSGDRTMSSAQADDIFYKPEVTLATLAAKRSWLGHVYLDWSQFPVVMEAGKASEGEDAGLTAVSFRDLRFMYDTTLVHGRETPPISGLALVDGDRKVVRMELNGDPQK